MMRRTPCCEKGHTNKGAWTREEDEQLISYIRAHGEGNWRSLPKAAGLLRCGKSCRLRWINYLRPDLKRGKFSEQEVDVIIKLHNLLGNRWSLIAGRLPGRTDNEIKNYWNTHLKRRLINDGIDPQIHRPFIASKTSIDSGDSNRRTQKPNLKETNHNTSAHASIIDNTTGNSKPPSEEDSPATLGCGFGVVNRVAVAGEENGGDFRKLHVFIRSFNRRKGGGMRGLLVLPAGPYLRELP